MRVMMRQAISAELKAKHAGHGLIGFIKLYLP
jgi:hypothetical protein